MPEDFALDHATGEPQSALGSIAFASGDGAALDLHDRLTAGVSARHLFDLRKSMVLNWTDAQIAGALGVTPRTLQRWNDATVLSSEQGSRLWKLASLLALATDVFGTRAAAEDWMQKPARALEGRAPLSLLTTGAGTELVETYLRQMDYGVYV